MRNPDRFYNLKRLLKRFPQRRLNQFVFRETGQSDIEQTFSIRASTRQNPIAVSRLVAWGFTPASVWEKYSTGEYLGWVCEDKGKVVGFISGEVTTGEILVLAVLPEYEGKKIGKTLLSLLVGSLRKKGRTSLWLSASPDPEIRAHGFYRANGWAPDGRTLENGDEILIRELPNLE
jgi:ribosomal protein S18 acetylase RimI-like enzyme